MSPTQFSSWTRSTSGRAVRLSMLACVSLALCIGGPVSAQESPEAQEAAIDGEPEQPVIPGQVADPSLALEAIVEKHLAARMPETEVQSIVATGSLVFMGLQLPMNITIARPRAARLEADMAGSAMILAFDGEDGWTVSPLQGIPTPEPLEEEAEEAVALFADFFWGLLAGAEAANADVELRGIEAVGNDETYALTIGGEYPRVLFVGGSDFLERRLLLDAVFMGAQQNLDVLLGDYRDIEGLMVPFDIQLLSGGSPMAQVVLEEVLTNQPVDTKIFDLPPPPPPQPEVEEPPV